MSILATGIIYFERTLSDTMYDDISYFIQEKANKNKIGVNLACNLTPYAMSKYKVNDKIIFEKSNMIYELTESPWFSQCEDLFSPVIYNGKGEGVGIDLSNSRLPSVQKFFTDVLDNQEVKEILFSLQENNPKPEEFERYSIHVSEFCNKISEAYTNTTTIGIAKMTPYININISK